MTRYENLTLDEERALYGIRGAVVENCTFDGPADGESALKECGDIAVYNCDMRLRYPLWHVHRAELKDVRMTDTCRAALWYDSDVTIKNSKLHGIKALRECDRSALIGCDIISPEFGWFDRGVNIQDCTLQAEYAFMHSRDMDIKGLHMTGKYSFQYVQDVVIRDSVLDTKDAFWHSKNVTVYDSVVKGEYLAWYSEGLTLIDCEMEGADFAFENSEVEATITTPVISIKNPYHGSIRVPEVGEMILDEHIWPGADCDVKIGE